MVLCYPMVKKFENMFSRLDRMPACDGRIDRRDLVTASSALCICIAR